MRKGSFLQYFLLRENNGLLDQPYIITADPVMKIPHGIKKLVEAFKKSKEISIGKEIDPKNGGEKDVTLKEKKLYIVGGAVRDYILNHTPKNYNIVTNAHPEEVKRIVQHANPPIKLIENDTTGGKTVVQVDEDEFVIHTMKSGKGFTTNIKEDAENRDLTINGLYYDISGNKIIDYVGGIQNIKDGIIKTIKNPSEAIKDNPLLTFKAIKLLNTMKDAKIDPELQKAIDSQEDIEVPNHQMKGEFIKGIECPHCDLGKFMSSYSNHGLSDKVFPGMNVDTEIPPGFPKNRNLVFAYILRNNNPEEISDKLDGMGYSPREIKDIMYLVKLNSHHPVHNDKYKKELMGTSITSRQMTDWAKFNNLPKDQIQGIYS